MPIGEGVLQLRLRNCYKHVRNGCYALDDCQESVLKTIENR